MYKNNNRFKPFSSKLYLASPTMHGQEELSHVINAFETNWLSTVGENINTVEAMLSEKIGCRYAVALGTGTSALHLAIKLAGERLYGKAANGKGALCGHRVFCTDLTFGATVNPVVYEGGEPVFIDSEYSTWNMDPKALERAFKEYPDVKLVVLVHLYGTPARIDEIKRIVSDHGALLVEDAAESLGASYRGRQTGSFGDYNCISFNGNKIITGSSGGAFLTDSKEDADTIRKWSTQSRENAPWYQHEDLGYNYRMSNIIAGVIRGQLPHLQEHVDMKHAIYERYKSGLKGLPISMNPFEEGISEPNYWLSCILIEQDGMCSQSRTALDATYVPETGKSCPTEILEAIAGINAEGRPLWKPMHMQPIFKDAFFMSAEGTNDSKASDGVVGDLFARGLCLPSDIKMTPLDQEVIINVIRACFE